MYSFAILTSSAWTFGSAHSLASSKNRSACLRRNSARSMTLPQGLPPMIAMEVGVYLRPRAPSVGYPTGYRRQSGQKDENGSGTEGGENLQSTARLAIDARRDPRQAS